jgi:ABC-type transport system substrate-binding protein
MNVGRNIAAGLFAGLRRGFVGQRRMLMSAAAIALGGCGVPNNPNPPGSEATNTYFTAIQEVSPKYLDPTSSYSQSEAMIVSAVYEPLFAYHYLKRPYVLEGLLAEEVPTPRYYNKAGRQLPDDVDGAQVFESVYDIRIKHGILFAPHPALARNADGSGVYDHLTAADVNGKFALGDFPRTGTREVVAEDFVYAIKRIATPRIKSSSFSIMNEYIVGMKDYAKRVRAFDADLRRGLPATARDLPFLDFRKIPFEGATAPDDHTLRIRVVGKYPQFKYWLAMTFFAPIPWEAEAFYSQPGMIEHNLTLNYWPAGTGPFMATEYIENRRHTLVRNPNFRGDPYPCEGAPGDKEAGLLDDCGKPMPFLDKVVFNIEKERLPMKTKWRSGYYDEPDLDHLTWGLEFVNEARDSDEAAAEFRRKGFRFPRAVDITNWYIGFNQWDPVVGRGKTPAEQERNRKLRQALQIAVDWEEYSQLFESQGKAGPSATGPVPPAVFGFREGREGINPYVYDWRIEDGQGHAVRKSIAVAQKLMEEAGYPGGRDVRTGQPLIINYDYQRIPTPELRAEIDWTIKQFAKLGVQLELRATDNNRWQDKMNAGSVQMFWAGWVADYPDAENFLALLYGPNSKAATKGQGENATNYQNDEYDRLYERLRYLEDGPEKQTTIDRMVEIARRDSPWLWGFNPFAVGSYQPWTHGAQPTSLIHEMLKYRRVDTVMRAERVREWNPPHYWPLWMIGLVFLLGLWPAWRAFRARERMNALGAQVPVAQRVG